jgi:hypothetical protein
MKHVEINYHFIRDRAVNKLLDVRFISTGDQLADSFTKALPEGRFREFQHNFNLMMLWLGEDVRITSEIKICNPCGNRIVLSLCPIISIAISCIDKTRHYAILLPVVIQHKLYAYIITHHSCPMYGPWTGIETGSWEAGSRVPFLSRKQNRHGKTGESARVATTETSILLPRPPPAPGRTGS